MARLRLGVVLDSDLTLSDHVTHCIQRALGRLRGLYRFKTLLPETAKLQIIQSVVLSNFYYCYPAYGNSISKEDTGRIQKLQNTAIRFVYDLKRVDHVSPFREVSNLALMETACRVQTCCMIHKTLTLQEPVYLKCKKGPCGPNFASIKKCFYSILSLGAAAAPGRSCSARHPPW